VVTFGAQSFFFLSTSVLSFACTFIFFNHCLHFSNHN
jgi:hypothetical protein